MKEILDIKADTQFKEWVKEIKQRIRQSQIKAAVLMNFIEADLYHAQGKSVCNFSKLLPAPQSDLAKETLKDPYNFDFLTLTEDYKERELEDALIDNITKFLLELGQGFAYVLYAKPKTTYWLNMP